MPPLLTRMCCTDIQRYWAGVETLQNQMMNVAGYLLFSVGLFVVRERYLGASWRLMLALTTVSLYVIDAPFQFLTIFGIVRNQYFFLGATLLSELPDAIFFVVSCFVIVEMAEEYDGDLLYRTKHVDLASAGPCSGSYPVKADAVSLVRLPLTQLQ